MRLIWGKQNDTCAAPGMHLTWKLLSPFLLVLNIIAWSWYEFFPHKHNSMWEDRQSYNRSALLSVVSFSLCVSQHKASSSNAQSVLIHLPRILSLLLWSEKWYSCLEGIQIMILQLMFVTATKKQSIKYLKKQNHFPMIKALNKKQLFRTVWPKTCCDMGLYIYIYMIIIKW